MNKFKHYINQKFCSGDIASNMIVSGICRPISLIISYTYVPIVLNYLGVEKYGVWSTILTIISWISYFDIGIGNGLRNRLTEAISNKNIEEGKKLVSSAYAFISIIMAALVFIFCTAAIFVNWEKVFGVTQFNENLTVIVCISVVFIAINFILSICKNEFYALQEASYVSVMELLIQILNLLGIFIIMNIVQSNLFCMALLHGLSMTTINLIFSIILYRKEKELLPKINSIDITAGKSLTNLGIQFFVIQICALVLFTTDNIIISYLYGAINVTPYSTVNKLFNAISSIYIALLVPLWSAVTKAKAEQKWDYIKSLIKKFQIIMLPFLVVVIVLIFIFKPLSGWWLGQKLNYSNGLIVLGGIYCILNIWCNIYSNVLNGLEIMKVSMITAVIQAGLNIPLSLLFSEGFGMKSAGVLCGTVLSMLIGAIIQPVYVDKYVNSKGNIKI